MQKLLRAVEAEKQGLKNRVWPHLGEVHQRKGKTGEHVMQPLALDWGHALGGLLLILLILLLLLAIGPFAPPLLSITLPLCVPLNPPPFPLAPAQIFGCGFFAYSWKLPAYSGAFLLTVDNFSFSAHSFSFFAYSFSFFTYSWSFFAYSGKVRLIRALRDCKQRSLTVSKKAPTVSKKAFPENQRYSHQV